MPGPLWGWFCWIIHGEIRGQGERWDGFVFRGGELLTPLGRSFTADQIDQLEMAFAELRAFHERARILQAEIDELKGGVSSCALSPARTLAIGGLSSAQAVLSGIWNDVKDADDVGLRRLSRELEQLVFQLCQLKKSLDPEAVARG